MLLFVVVLLQAVGLKSGFVFFFWLTLRAQVPNNHILARNLYYSQYYPKPKYLIVGYMDPLGKGSRLMAYRAWGLIRA